MQLRILPTVLFWPLILLRLRPGLCKRAHLISPRLLIPPCLNHLGILFRFLLSPYCSIYIRNYNFFILLAFYRSKLARRIAESESDESDDNEKKLDEDFDENMFYTGKDEQVGKVFENDLLDVVKKKKKDAERHYAYLIYWAESEAKLKCGMSKQAFQSLLRPGMRQCGCPRLFEMIICKNEEVSICHTPCLV